MDALLPMAPLWIDVRCPSPGTALVTVAGEIDLSNADLLRARLILLMSVFHPQHTEVDLAGVTLIDCSGLTALLVASGVAAHHGGRLWVTNPQPLVVRVLELTGLRAGLTAGSTVRGVQ